MARGKPFKPTPEQRAAVHALASFGTPQERIAQHLKILPKALRRHFRDELDSAVEPRNAAVAQNMYRIATLPATKNLGPVVAAGFKWLELQAGWISPQRGTGPGGSIPLFDMAAIAKLSDREIEQLDKLLAKLGVGLEEEDGGA